MSRSVSLVGALTVSILPYRWSCDFPFSPGLAPEGAVREVLRWVLWIPPTEGFGDRLRHLLGDQAVAGRAHVNPIVGQ